MTDLRKLTNLVQKMANECVTYHDAMKLMAQLSYLSGRVAAIAMRDQYGKVLTPLLQSQAIAAGIKDQREAVNKLEPFSAEPSMEDIANNQRPLMDILKGVPRAGN